MRIILAGATSQTIYVEVLDSTSTTGGRKTGLVFNTAGLTAYYARNGGSATSITLATLAAANSAYSSGGFKEVDATNMPGVYRLDLPDAAVAASAASVVVTLKGAAGMVQVSAEIQLTAVNLQDSVRAGLTALPNAAAEAAGGLYTRGTGAGQINQPVNGRVDVNTIAVSGTTQTARDIGASVLLSAGTGTGQLDFASGVVKANLAQILGTALTETAGQIAAAFKQFFDVASPTGTMKAITNVVTATNLTNLPAITSNWLTAAGIAASALNGKGDWNVGKTGYSLSSAGIQAIWDALTSALTTVGSVGKLIVDNLNATISSRSSHAAADVWSVGARTLTAATNITSTGGTTVPQTGDSFVRLGAPAGASVSADIAAVKADTAAILTDTAEIGAAGAGLTALATQASVNTIDDFLDTEIAAIKAKTDNLPASPAATGDIPTAAATADAVWDEAIAGHLGAGSTGTALNSAGSAGDPWSTAIPGVYGAGTAGKIVGDNLNATVSSRSSHSAADVWTAVTRTLTAASDSSGVTTLLSRIIGTLATGTHEPQSGDAYARIGAAGAGLTALGDTRLANLNAPVSSRAIAGDAMALTSGERTTLTAVVWAYVVEGSYTALHYMRLMASALLAKLSGGGTATNTFRDTGDTKNRITATVDADGNRTAVTLDGS